MSLDFKLAYSTDAEGTKSQDLAVELKDLVILSGSDELTLHLKILLQFIEEEWFLDTSVGIDYFGKVWVKNPDISAIDREIKRKILQEDGVISFLEYSSDYNASQRSFSVNFRVSTIYGDVELVDTLSEVS